MTTPGMSQHIAVRMQQRGIPPLVIDWLRQYGDEAFDHRGASLRYFSRNSRRLLKRDVGAIPYRRMSDYLDCYLVEAGGQVVTTGRRYQHLSRQS